MAFDQPTRTRLQKFVNEARELLTVEFTRQLQQDYGMAPATGEVTDVDRLTHIDTTRRETARLLRDTLTHYQAANPTETPSALMARIVREQAFTVLNRLCALRMAEARGVALESIGRGYDSQGFQLYKHAAKTGLGETGDTYRCYLFSLFDEFAVDLAVLFDRYAPMGRLFPRNAALLELLDLINAPDLEPLWAEDETIGWIYQYFNSVEERRQMRKDSQAPRNSRELAVRNQFFTPRYVVEFLTDNTLGRIWYEMTQGHTALKDACRYLVRRPNEIFLQQGEAAPDSAPEERSSQTAIDDKNSAPEEWHVCSSQTAIDDKNSAPEGRHVCSSSTAPGQHIAPEERHVCSPANAPNNFSPDGAACAPDAPHDMSPRRGLHDSASSGFYTHAAPPELHTTDANSGFYTHDAPPELHMTDANSGFYTHAASPELQRPVYIPFRQRKDPRDIRMLDPACGSMHFGLYAFDLFERMYAEAWEMEDLTPSPSERGPGGEVFHLPRLQRRIPARRAAPDYRA